MLNWLINNQKLHLISISECAVTLTVPFGVITSPGYPQSYRNGIDCSWNIQLSSGQLIQFNFLHFDVESTISCGWVNSASDIFCYLINGYFYHNTAHILISGVILSVFLMEIQIHHPCWQIHIVVIPCHPVKSLQATISSSIFILII